ncbi:MAG: tetratricopeptide repeat protein [Chloroflexi bacterium]|nr:tetratricopeptide repeat protein [Chloroflexota bacterium]
MIDYRGKRFLFSKPKRSSNPKRVFFLLLLILASLFVLRSFSTGQIKPLMMATPTPTRTLGSYALEGETHFLSGNLEKAIEAYQNAVSVNPTNATLWAELARIQVYSTSQFTTDQEKKTRLEEAFRSVEEGLKIAPDDSQLYAVRAFAMDWYGVSSIAGENWQDFLNNGEQAAVQALQLDSTNALALAYYAELLVDQQKWTQAAQYIAQALERDDTLMDVHRVNGYVQESTANYSLAITEYQKAIEITPNLNFLYISLGANYRKLANLSDLTPERDHFYTLALEAFDKAAKINEQLGVKDPIPLISIANTYVQMGQALAASRNMLAALLFKPQDPTAYGQVGVVYYKARNYEGSILPLRCAVRGCTALETCTVRNGGAECDEAMDTEKIVIAGLPLSTNTVLYYYIYGSVLAGMNMPANQYCVEGMKVFREITAGFSGDETIMAIVNEGVKICNNQGFQ